MSNGGNKLRGRTVPTIKQKPRMVLVGDSPTVTTGFASVMRNLMEHWEEHYDMHTLGINYMGDYHPLSHKYKIWPAANGPDVFGITKLAGFVDHIKPEIVFILNDPWVAIDYEKAIEEIRENNPQVKLVLYTPVDSRNVRTPFVEPLNTLFDRVTTYTQFGQMELMMSGLNYMADVVPHGINTEIFYPLKKTKQQIKKELRLPEDVFIILTVARNSVRKGLDLTVEAFSEWVRKYDIPKNVRWYYHGALQDVGYDIIDLCRYYKVGNRLILSPEHTASTGLSDENMLYIYNASNMYFTTTKAEGWCLPLMEAMACRIPCIVPEHSALAEWPRGGVEYFNAPLRRFAINGLNTVHLETDIPSAVEALQRVYSNGAYRDELANNGYKLVTQDIYKWKNIANRFVEIFKEL